MPALIPSFIIDLADPIERPEKFLWKELAGDMFQEFGRALDAKARIREIKPHVFELQLAFRDDALRAFGPYSTLHRARKKAEAEYSNWIRKSEILEGRPKIA